LTVSCEFSASEREISRREENQKKEKQEAPFESSENSNAEKRITNGKEKRPER
jgi:hypothetical protein